METAGNAEGAEGQRRRKGSLFVLLGALCGLVVQRAGFRALRDDSLEVLIGAESHDRRMFLEGKVLTCVSMTACVTQGLPRGALGMTVRKCR
ncbi:MAG: hypothetical protein JWP27_2695 [Flaviaesturariibacter sp.]|nr:hypothetical protein [Flaviaesturariibacter sp.]